MRIRNITLSLPADLVRRAKVLAAQRDTSVSRIMTEALTDLVSREEGYEAAQRRHLAVLRRGVDLGTHGRASWTREALHER
ncbi:MAG: CopG family transcriptional regulator [Armatimonadota bacterium]